MLPIRHLSRHLSEPPVVPVITGVAVRNYAGTADIAAWLDLRHRGFAAERIPIRPWDAGDFQREMIAKPWWKPENLWLAEDPAAGASRLVGAVTLAMRGSESEGVPVVHWLMVAPEWRRRGMGRLLMTALEMACWEQGLRQVSLETHIAWTAANRFYETLGYSDRFSA